MNRRVALLLAPALTAALLVAPSHAAAGKPVVPGDLLTAAQVQTAFPSAESPERKVTKVRRTDDMSKCGGASRVKVRSGRAVELTPPMSLLESPEFAANPTPMVMQEVVEMRSVGAAKKVLKNAKTVVRRCKGKVELDEGMPATIKTLKMPALGQDRGAFTMKMGLMPGMTVTMDYHVVRKKARVMTVVVAYFAKPKRARGTALVRTAARTAL